MTDFIFTVSAPHQVAPDEITTIGQAPGVAPRYGDEMLRIELSADTDLENAGGGKINQRTELTEDPVSRPANMVDGVVFYSWSLYVDPVTQTPTDGPDGTAPGMVLSQFHDEAADGSTTRPPLVLELTEDGDLAFQMTADLGGAAFTVLDGGPDGHGAKGQWIDLVVAADWSTGMEGSLQIWAKTADERDYTQIADYTGANTTTGQIYAKFGAYRSFLERDPAYADTDAVIYFDGIARGDSFAGTVGSAIDNGIGAVGDDVLTGGRGDTVSTGNDGADTILGGNGDDTLDGGNGSDLLDGGHGADDLSGDNGADILQGGTGNDVLDGGYGSDELYGGHGHDTLFGGAGQDLLEGGTGHDMLDGGDNNDTLIGGHGRDTLIGGDGYDSLDGGTGHDVLDGGDGKDNLIGGHGNDTLIGGLLDDLMDGGTGRDELIGGAGNDRLTGGHGRDHLTGGAGDDVLTGGTGADTFIFDFAADMGEDVITDFEWRKDTLLILNAGAYMIAEAMEGVLLEYGDDSILLEGADLAQVEHALELA